MRKLKIDLIKEAKRAARTIIGEPSRNRARGPHKYKRKDPDEDFHDMVEINDLFDEEE